jgi:hypothetical protein
VSAWWRFVRGASLAVDVGYGRAAFGPGSPSPCVSSFSSITDDNEDDDEDDYRKAGRQSIAVSMSRSIFFH